MKNARIWWEFGLADVQRRYKDSHLAVHDEGDENKLLVSLHGDGARQRSRHTEALQHKSAGR